MTASGASGAFVRLLLDQVGLCFTISRIDLPFVLCVYLFEPKINELYFF